MRNKEGGANRRSIRILATIKQRFEVVSKGVLSYCIVGRYNHKLKITQFILKMLFEPIYLTYESSTNMNKFTCGGLSTGPLVLEHLHPTLSMHRLVSHSTAASLEYAVPIKSKKSAQRIILDVRS